MISDDTKSPNQAQSDTTLGDPAVRAPCNRYGFGLYGGGTFGAKPKTDDTKTPAGTTSEGDAQS